MTDLAEMLGPVPYEDVWVSFLPEVSDGIELGSAVQLAELQPGEDDWLVAHELAHLWFHGLVGNNQAQDPWLDETLATYIQEVVRPQAWDAPHGSQVDGLGLPMAAWESRPGGSTAYVETVYTHGGALLSQQREEVGGAALDGALRTYLREQAHRIAEPDNLRAVLGNLPSVDRALDDAGAWDGS